MHYKGINIFRHKVIFMDFLVFQCIYFQIIKAKVVNSCSSVINWMQRLLTSVTHWPWYVQHNQTFNYLANTDISSKARIISTWNQYTVLLQNYTLTIFFTFKGRYHWQEVT